MEEKMRLINNASNERNRSWIVEVDDKLCKMGSLPETGPQMNKKNTIYRRPVHVRENEDTFLYTPRIVSFGPYHHHHISCQQTNKSKELVLLHWLKRSGKRLKDYVEALDEVVQDLKDSYDELDPCWEQEEDSFLQLMIYDGCLLLEILSDAESFNAGNHLGHLSRQVLAMFGISPDELMEYYKHDVLLLENQLPMQLLVKLVAVQNNQSIQAAEEDLYKRIIKFISPSSLNIAEKLPTQKQELMYLHVLDLYRHSLLYYEPYSDLQIGESTTLDSSVNSDDKLCPSYVYYCFGIIICILISVILLPFAFLVVLLPLAVFAGITLILAQVLKRRFWSKPSTSIYFIIPSATELDKVGIGFNVNKTKSLKDISFGSRTLRLPKIYVDGATQSRFLNIIAFEQLHADAKSEVTSYIYFMSRLLKVAGDVRLLQLRGIIHTPLHNDQVAALFQSLSKDIVHDPNIFLDPNYCNVSKTLTESFYSKMNNVWQRDLWQTYLKSPWAVISAVAAFFLFALTLIQTLYTVMSYYSE